MINKMKIDNGLVPTKRAYNTHLKVYTLVLG